MKIQPSVPFGNHIEYLCMLIENIWVYQKAFDNFLPKWSKVDIRQTHNFFNER